MPELRAIHSLVANTVILYLLACGLWGLVAYFASGRRARAAEAAETRSASRPGEPERPSAPSPPAAAPARAGERAVVSPSYTGALLIGEALLILQGLLGVVIVLSSPFPVPRDPMHLLYGIASVVALPLAFSYLKGRTDRRAQLVLALVALFTFGLAVRALTTGR